MGSRTVHSLLTPGRLVLLSLPGSGLVELAAIVASPDTIDALVRAAADDNGGGHRSSSSSSKRIGIGGGSQSSQLAAVAGGSGAGQGAERVLWLLVLHVPGPLDQPEGSSSATSGAAEPQTAAAAAAAAAQGAPQSSQQQHIHACSNNAGHVYCLVLHCLHPVHPSRGVCLYTCRPLYPVHMHMCLPHPTHTSHPHPPPPTLALARPCNTDDEFAGFVLKGSGRGKGATSFAGDVPGTLPRYGSAGGLSYMLCAAPAKQVSGHVCLMLAVLYWPLSLRRVYDRYSHTAGLQGS